MKLQIENIGKIKNANINISGLTLITGENDTGKSTIGKIMFGVTMTMIYSERWEKKRKEKEVEDILSRIFDIIGQDFFRNINTTNIDTLIYKIKPLIDEYRLNEEKNEEIKSLLLRLINLKTNKNRKEIFENDLNKILRSIFSYNINCVLNNNIGKISFKNGQDLELEIKDNKIKINNDIEINNKFAFTSATFVENPLILDYRDRLSDKYKNDERYKKDLIEYHICEELKDLAEISKNKDYIEKRKQIIKEIEKEINYNITNYNDIYFDNGGNLKFKISDNCLQELDISNMASGGKSFSMLELLILGSYINDRNDHLIILDEPENHLHPEWQIKYAHIIIWLVKRWKCNFIINSHSPYLVKGLEHYAKIYNIKENDLNFHIAENDKENKNYSNIKKVDNLSEIFNKFYQPLLKVMESGK
jgi:predicted ATPase